MERFSLFNTHFRSSCELFKTVSSQLLASGFVTQGFEEALNERENSFPTALPVEPPVAIPHTDGSYVKKDAIFCVLNDEGIAFGEMGGDKGSVLRPRLVFVLAMQQGDAHLEELQHLVERLQDSEAIQTILRSEDMEDFKKSIMKFL